ncbi:MAG TPA: TMEM175 family protein [Microlunatus sp.]|nr:TMEM175 family protein [Microlunatus sp.]
MSDTNTSPATGGPDVERGIALVDAVVAIAMTLLILPLVEVAGEVDPGHIGDFLGENWDLFLSFVISFAVIFVFWSAHATAIRPLAGRHRQVPALSSLTLLWLLLIAFLPFPTAIVGRNLTTVTAPLYIGTMFLLSLTTTAIGLVARRAAAVPTPFHAGWAWSTSGLLLLSTIISLFNADAGMYSLLALWVARVLEVRSERRRAGA